MMEPLIGREALRRILSALVVTEARRTHGVDYEPACDNAGCWPDDLRFDETGIGLDSLDAIHAAAAINEMFHLAEVESDPAPRKTVGAWLDGIEAAQNDSAARLTVLTSGSTGTPTRCSHLIRDLSDEAEHFARMFGDRSRVLALVPAHHIYGLIWTALLPDRLDIPVAAAAVGAMPRTRAGDLIVAVPDQWRALLRSHRVWPKGIIGISAGAPLDNGVAADLLAAGLTRLVDVYGASETGGIATRDAPDDAYTLLPRWRFADTDEQELSHLIDCSGRIVPVIDLLHRRPDERFVLAGRRDGAVQVGGVNVWPSRVAAVLRQCADVADAAVRTGNAGRLKAFIVPAMPVEAAALKKRIEDYARGKLTPSERPMTYSFGDVLPLNSLGKAMDWL